MKFRKIEIKNIASIGDATIAFDESPLANEPLFLICGATGSGKSTILDAICLALYGTAPRLEGYGNEKYDDKKLNIQGNDTFVRLSDPCQMVRRDTGEAYARLSFIGNDKLHYIATWHATRGTKRKLDVKLKTSKTLLCSETGTTISGEEVKKEIARPEVVGLKFDEFCRTTLLAQGAFTRFLNSKSDEKSDILEKLTGTEVYSRISKEIYNSYIIKDRQYKEKLSKIESLRLLSEEEREEKIAQRKEEEKLIVALKKQYEDFEKKISWLNSYEDCKKSTLKAETELSEAQKKNDTPESENDRHLLADWERSDEVRHSYVTLQRLIVERDNIAQETEKARQKYILLAAGNSAMQENMQQNRERCRLLCQKMENAVADIPMYENAGTLIAQMQEYMRKMEEIRSIKNEQNKNKELLPQITISINTHAAEREKIENILLKKSEEHKQAIEKQKQLPSIAETDARKELIIKIASLHKEKMQATERLDNLRKRIEEIEKTIKEKNIKLQKEEKDKNEAEATRKEREELYSTMLMRLDNHAKALRAKLKEGDICPVCGAEISELLQDSELMAIIAPIEKECKDSIRNYEEKLGAYNNSIITIKSQTELLEATYAQQRAESETEKNAALDLEALCKEANITSSPEHLHEAIENERRKINELQQKNEELSKYILAIYDEILKLRQSLTIVMQKLTIEISRRKQTEDNIKQQDELQQNINNSMLLLQKEITNGKITIIDWHENIRQSIDDLKARSTAYQKAKEQQQKLEQSVKELSEYIQRIENLQTEVEKLHPLWKETYHSKETNGHSDNELEREWMELAKHCNVLKNNDERITKEIATTENIIKAFHLSNPSMTQERVELLLRYSPEDIRTIKEKYTLLNKEIENNKTLLSEWKKRCENLLQLRPDIAEEDNIYSLTNKKNEIAEQRSQADKRVGAITLELEQDSEKSKLVEQERAEAEQLNKESGKWERLNKIFGSAEGGKFKAIAQSYILRQLLENANYYLSRFTTRYELTTQPGTLVILIKDHEDGDVSRPANTLSGGESFMVSLALALGLSSLNRNNFTPDTIFIDEGFGTLSGDCLNTVIETLEILHNIGNRKVGIISHVNELYERIATRIEVKRGTRESVVKIVG